MLYYNKENNMSGTLYIVGTPIGNLGDISARALETLNRADFIAAEDTRVTLKLLSRFEIRKPLISCREHNERSSAQIIAERVAGGENCALVTDAGMPCISDPGGEVVRLFAESCLPMVVVPGPSAVIAALALGGIGDGRFCFEGFLSMNRKQRSDRLKEISGYKQTLVFYEAPHKLRTTLADLQNHLGDRQTALCRELTKIHEETLRGKLSELSALYESLNPRGEYVIVVEGCKDDSSGESALSSEETLERAAVFAENLVAEGEKASLAAGAAAKQFAVSKGDVYKRMMADKEQDEE
jgi:16S rRNA (cytidine1402-2'-O)-methyltransferase